MTGDAPRSLQSARVRRSPCAGEGSESLVTRDYVVLTLGTPRRILSNRRPSPDRGATCCLRVDEQLPANQFQALPHARQAQAETMGRRRNVEADTFIANGELDGVAGSAKTNLDVLAPAVPNGVVQGFLENPEEAERHVRRDTGRDVVDVEIDPDPLLIAESLTEAARRGLEPHIHQIGWVELV